MIRLTKLTDYGMILLMQMAGLDEGEVFNARDLAEAAHLPQPMVSKILKALARADVLRSRRGVKGGYSLGRPAAEITVAQIIRALEGPIAITECMDETTSTCDIERLCPIKSNWQKINDAVRDALEGITLAEMSGAIDFKFRPPAAQGAPQTAPQTASQSGPTAEAEVAASTLAALE